jgi:hypothetical protein
MGTSRTRTPNSPQQLLSTVAAYQLAIPGWVKKKKFPSPTLFQDPCRSLGEVARTTGVSPRSLGCAGRNGALNRHWAQIPSSTFSLPNHTDLCVAGKKSFCVRAAKSDQLPSKEGTGESLMRADHILWCISEGNSKWSLPEPSSHCRL